MMKSLLRSGGAIAFAAAKCVALCQNVPNTPFLTLPERSAILITNSHFQSRLGLTPAQLKEVRLAVDYHSTQQKTILQNPTPFAVEKLERSFTDHLLKVLKPNQSEKLIDLAAGDLGPEGLAEAPIADKVGLTADQRTKVADLLRQYADKEQSYENMVGQGLQAIPTPKSSTQYAAYGKKCQAVTASYAAEKTKVDKFRTTTDAGIIALLSTSQRAKWKAMTGG